MFSQKHDIILKNLREGVSILEENQKNDSFDDESMSLKDFDNEEIAKISPDEPYREEESSKNQEEFETIDSTQEKKDIEQNNYTQEENSALKKYIMHISQEFVPIIDSMTIDQRIAYINDAIQIKIDFQKEKDLKNKKKQFGINVLIIILVFILTAPLALIIANKAIMLTFENYRYSQENFEKLYKQRFEKDSAYMRSIQYNKKHSIK